MSKKYTTARTPKALTLKTALNEFLYSTVQNTYGVAMMTEMMLRAKKLGFVKNPKQFRQWTVNEMFTFIPTLDKWLQEKCPELPEGRKYKPRKTPKKLYPVDKIV